jgi:hypothetical protein
MVANIHVFAGDAKPTAARLVVDLASGRVTARALGPGDSTVLRTSAVGPDPEPHHVGDVDVDLE